MIGVSSLRKYVLVVDFGYPEDPEELSTIDDLAQYVCDHYLVHRDDGWVILAQSETYGALRQMGFWSNQIIELGVSQSTTVGGLRSGGSFEVVQAARDYLRAHEKRKPKVITLVAHSLHAKRVVRQGQIVGLKLRPAPNLPEVLYKSAAQWWCRSKWGWYLREVIGYLPLKLTGQL